MGDRTDAVNTVTDRDNGWKALRARVAKLKGARVRVGILDDAPKQESSGAPPSKLTVAEVAAIHEFGAPEANIPQRSFVRATVDAKAAEIAALQHGQASAVFQGKTELGPALDRIGAKVASMMQATIAAGITPPLKPETVERKGSSKPLVNTGQLKSSITWKVVA